MILFEVEFERTFPVLHVPFTCEIRVRTPEVGALPVPLINSLSSALYVLPAVVDMILFEVEFERTFLHVPLGPKLTRNLPNRISIFFL